MRHISILGRIRVSGFGLCAIKHIVTKTSEASWSYSCDSKVSFDRVQILTPDFSGRRPPPPPRPSAPLPSSPPPSSQVRLRPVVALWHAVSVAYLAAALAHSHSHCLTVSLSHCLTVSLSLCLSLSLISLISLISFSSLSSLSPLSLSPLCLSSFRLSSLSSLAGGSGQEPHIKDSSPLPPKRAPCFFLPRCPPLSHSGALAFAPPLASSVYILYISYHIILVHLSKRAGR